MDLRASLHLCWQKRNIAKVFSNTSFGVSQTPLQVQMKPDRFDLATACLIMKHLVEHYIFCNAAGCGHNVL